MDESGKNRNNDANHNENEIVAGKPIELKVGNNLKHRRIDKYLHGRFSNYSRVMLQEIIKAGAVTVNGEKVKQSYKLTPGEIIVITLPELPKREIVPQDIPLDIIYEDDDLLVINKQTNIIVHPARGYKDGTLVNALAYHCQNLSSGLGEMRPGIVHRLDRNTTGVMVVAKNDIAQWKIAKQFQERTTKKSYIAIVQGCPELSADQISEPLGVHKRVREKYAVRADGKEAISRYRVLEEFRGYSLLQVRILTGRTHQIRVHLSHIKHAIVADDMYGGKVPYLWQIKNAEPALEEPIIARVCLHAYSLEFVHPSTGQPAIFQAPLPEDMENFLKILRKYRKKK